MNSFEKRLRPTTIIPAQLYVERGADRQLNQIITDMGRPGYVLVARQMGKTNLLINMKRSREQQGDIVLYHDLSNRFASARAFFRSIIDALIESHPSAFNGLSDLIHAQRREESIEPNNEYDRHLRLILRSAPEKRVIIIFDEIDSLVSSAYSDAIFAQIRSMYFSRINHDEYNRLTYTLSGVAEPTDLIKDKNISPFNIGEKIYLDDFSMDEFTNLLYRAGIVISDATKDEIYTWTRGNPRMTWDVSSAVEDLIVAGQTASPEDVRDIVRKLYLTQFDRAPVDHIRTLVEGDPFIRNAVISIRWNKAATLDEKTQGRLYLAGITGISDAGGPRIKNPIIDAALSDSWLAQVSAGQRTLLEAANDSFLAGSYEQTIRLIEEYARGLGSDARLPVASQYQLGAARYHLGQHGRSALDLAAALEAVEDEAVATSVRFFLGSALLKAGKPAEAIPIFEQVADRESEYQLGAKLALGSAHLTMAPKDNREIILRLNEEIADQIGLVASERSLTPEESALLASAHYNSAQVEQAAGNPPMALSHLERGLVVAPPLMRPRIMIQISLLSSIDIDRRKWLSEAVDYTISQEITFGESWNTLSFSETVLTLILTRALSLNEISPFDALMHYARGVLFHHVHSELDVVLRLAKTMQNSSETIPLSHLLWHGASFYLSDDVPIKKRLELSKLLAVLSPPAKRVEAHQIYLRTFDARLAEVGLDDDDVVVLLVASMDFATAGNHIRALETLSLSDNFTGEIDPYISTLMQFQIMNSQAETGRLDVAKSVAEGILDSINEEALGDAGASANATFNYIRNHARAMLRRRPVDPFRKFGRNQMVRVRDSDSGQEKIMKFKKAEIDLRSGRFILIS